MRAVPDAVLDAPRRVARAAGDLHLLVVFGSRATGQARPESDWDFAYLAGAGFDADELLARLAETLHADRVDLVDLARAGGQLRYRVAAEGWLVYEARTGTYDRFWLDAVSFWCDVAPVIRAAYEGYLSELSR